MTTYRGYSIHQKINLKGNAQVIYPNGFERHGWQWAVGVYDERQQNDLSRRLWNHNAYGKHDSFKRHQPKRLKNQS